MPRAHRHYLPGYIWHITHRCHDRSFLLSEAATRSRWVDWLSKARLDHGITVLNYSVTCNHIHLLTTGGATRDVIPRSIQLIAGRTAQEFNADSFRHGAFWEDRYHATAVDSGSHLLNCLTYIDLNMVRAGAVDHPADWVHSGYWEIREPAQRNRLIDHDALSRLLGARDMAHLRTLLDSAVSRTMADGLARDGKWTDAVAVGSPSFLDGIKTKLGSRASRRSIAPPSTAQKEWDHSSVLREPRAEYGAAREIHAAEVQGCVLDGDNTHLWQIGQSGSDGGDYL